MATPQNNSKAGLYRFYSESKNCKNKSSLFVFHTDKNICDKETHLFVKCLGEKRNYGVGLKKLQNNMNKYYFVNKY